MPRTAVPSTRRIEWRTPPSGRGALIAVDDGANEVVRAWSAEPRLLADFLNDMVELQNGSATDVDVTDTDPAGWGELVIARSADGDILFIDPEMYWNGISDLFRTRGDDPHPWRGRS